MTMTQTTLSSADPRKLTIVPEIRALVPALSAAEREALTNDIKEKGAILTPVLIDHAGNVIDGHNRVDIAIELEMDEVPVTIVQLSDEDDAKRLAIESNLNRRHLTLQARKKVARTLLKLTPWKSNRQIAKEAGIDPKTVGSQREEAEAAGEIEEQTTTVGADNRARPTTRKPSATESNESKIKEQYRSDVSALKTGLDELLGKLDRKKMPALSAEAFVGAMTPAQKKSGWATEGILRVVTFWEDVLHLLEDEAEAKADAEKTNTVSAPVPGPAAPSTPEGNGTEPF